MDKGSNKTSRREFLYGAAGAVAAFTVVPRHVLGGRAGAAPSEKLNIAIIGVGGRGGASVGG
ncbi:MAG: ubiquinol-cytochrome c reductase iron-sulfur subunit N-terminal domain-containing protein, partial [Planctomycetota bacterium]